MGVVIVQINHKYLTWLEGLMKITIVILIERKVFKLPVS